MSRKTPADPCVLIVAESAAGMEALRPTREMLDAFGLAWTETLATAAGAGDLDLAGVRAVIVASADAALPGALAAVTARPVLRVPIADGSRENLALIYDPATEDLPADETPFATVAIGEAGAKNAALFAISVLALDDARLWSEWMAFRQRQTDAVLASPPPSLR